MIDAELFLATHRRRTAELQHEARSAGLAAQVREARRAARAVRASAPAGVVDCGRLAAAG